MTRATARACVTCPFDCVNSAKGRGTSLARGFGMDFEFLKDRYDFELARKDDLTSALTLPVGVLSGLGGLMAAMAQSFPYGRVGWDAPFLLAFTLDTLAFVAALHFLARAYHGQDYGYLPRLGELRQDQEELDRYFVEHGGDQDLARAEFQRQLERRIIEAADTSAMSNDRRSTFLHRARQSLLAVLILTSLTGIVYVLATVI